MATELLELQLEELSLVDRPANAEAMVTLFKRDDTPETKDVNKMTEEQGDELKSYMEKHSCGKEEAMKVLGYGVEKAEEADPGEELKAEIETLKADAEKLTLENERLRKGLIEEGYVIAAESIEKAAPEEFIEYGGEKINKSDVPAPILKALEEAEFAKADAALTKRAEAELPNFSVEVAKGLLTAVEKMDEVEMLMEALMAADKAFEQKMEEFGKSDVNGDFDSPDAKLDAMAKAYASEQKVSYAKAYADVIKTDGGKALVKEVYKKG